MVIRRHEYAIYIVIYGDEQERIINTDSLVYNKESQINSHNSTWHYSRYCTKKYSSVSAYDNQQTSHAANKTHTHTYYGLETRQYCKTRKYLSAA